MNNVEFQELMNQAVRDVQPVASLPVVAMRRAARRRRLAAAAIAVAALAGSVAVVASAADRNSSATEFAAPTSPNPCGPEVLPADCADTGVGSLNSSGWRLVFMSHEAASPRVEIINRTYSLANDPKVKVGTTVFRGAVPRVSLEDVRANDPTAVLVPQVTREGNVIRTGPGEPAPTSYQWTSASGATILVMNLSGTIDESTMFAFIRAVEGGNG